jgi:hypothetical protein
MEMPQMPQLYTDNPEIKKMRDEMNRLNLMSQQSYSFKSDWREKESINQRMKDLEKRIDLKLEESRVKYEEEMKKYNEDITKYEKELEGRKKQLKSPIQSLDVE